MLEYRAVRAVLSAVLPVFGRTVCRDHVGHWNVVDGNIVRTLYPMGWRIAKIGDTEPQSQLGQFIKRLGR